jgi:hypothetical protein
MRDLIRCLFRWSLKRTFSDRGTITDALSGAAEMELVPLGPDFGVEIRGMGLLDVAASDKAYQSVRAANQRRH